MSTSVTNVVSHFPSAENGFTTTLASTISSGTTTVPLNSLAGYTNGEVVVFVVDPSDPSKKQTFTGIADTTGVQVTSVVWTAGTDQSHTGGATVVDYATATHISMVTKGILVNHSQTGSHIQLTDANGNEWLKHVATTSAINEITVANAATGSSPSASATGGDTNIDLNLFGKGTGSARHAGPYDGWVAAGETWTYASTTSFTCSATLAALLGKGDRIKLTQTTTKYFFVTSVSGTTINITGGSDYTLANAAITLPFYSHEISPSGYPNEFSVTAALTNLTLGSGTVSLVMRSIGNLLQYHFKFTLGSGSSVSTSPQFVAPVTIKSSTYGDAEALGYGSLIDTGAAAYAALPVYINTTTIEIRTLSASGSYTQQASVTSSVPFSFGNTDTLNVQGEYRF